MCRPVAGAGVKHRGGFRNYALPQRDILSWLREDQNADARFTTAFDLYRLPSDFPGYGDAQDAVDPYEKVRILEAALRDDIGDLRFIPYLQVHEFETLLLSEPGQLAAHFTDGQARVQNLVATAGQIANPELINEGPGHRTVQAHYRRDTGIRGDETIGWPDRDGEDRVGDLAGQMPALW